MPTPTRNQNSLLRSGPWTVRPTWQLGNPRKPNGPSLILGLDTGNRGRQSLAGAVAETQELKLNSRPADALVPRSMSVKLPLNVNLEGVLLRHGDGATRTVLKRRPARELKRSNVDGLVAPRRFRSAQFRGGRGSARRRGTPVQAPAAATVPARRDPAPVPAAPPYRRHARRRCCPAVPLGPVPATATVPARIT